MYLYCRFHHIKVTSYKSQNVLANNTYCPRKFRSLTCNGKEKKTTFVPRPIPQKMASPRLKEVLGTRLGWSPVVLCDRQLTTPSYHFYAVKTLYERYETNS